MKPISACIERPEIAALPHQQIKILPEQRDKIEPRRFCRGAGRDAAIGLAGADRGGEIGTGKAGRIEPAQILRARRRRASAAHRAASARPRRAAAPPLRAGGQDIGEAVELLADCRAPAEGPVRAAPTPTRTASCRPGIARAAAILASRIVDDVGLVEMDGGGDHLAALQPIDAARGALGRARQGRSRIRAASIPAGRPGCRRRWAAGRRGSCRWPGQSRKHPEVQFVARKQPLARHLAAGNRAFGHQLVELALAKPEIVGSLAGGQEFHPALLCIFLRMFNRLTNAELLRNKGERREQCPTNCSAWQLILSGDPALFAIVRLSLAVSLSAVVLAALSACRSARCWR